MGTAKKPDRKKLSALESELIRKNAEIKERVKELTCLYQLSAVAHRDGADIREILQTCIEIIPPAYQFPAITCTRILLDGLMIRSRRFKETKWKQEAPIIVNGKKFGSMQVFYKEKKPASYEGPFLREERLLLNSMADILSNVVERNLAEQEVLKLNRLYQFISEINASILKAGTTAELYKEACRIAVEKGSFLMAWIGVYDDKQDRVRPVTWAGNESGYLEKARIIGSDKKAAGRGPSGRAIRTGKYQYCNDIARDPIMKPWRQEALKRNYRSSICIPLMVDNELESLYTLYMSQPFFFNDTEIKLLLEVADNLSFALDKLWLKELQQRSQEQLKESEDKFRGLVEQTTVGVYIFQHGRFSYINPGLEKMVGMSMDELNRSDIMDMIHESDKGELAAVKHPAHRRRQVFTLRFRRKDGSLLYMELRNSLINYAGGWATLGTVLDITATVEEQKRIEKAVTKTQEEERRQIGMELHDNVQQILVGSLLALDFARTSKQDLELVDSIHQKLDGYIREAIAELRRLSHQLAPSIEAEGGLRDKVADLVTIMKAHSDIQVDIQIPQFRPTLRNDIQLTLYRILQEQFSNILKYANAHKVLIRLEKKQNLLHLLVKDDGIGFQPGKHKKGIGLENMRRRVNVMDGHFSIHSSVGNGCEIRVEIPLASHKKPATD